MEKVKALVFELLEKDVTGHGIDHIVRVYDLALDFAQKEGADEAIVGLAALLHDVDDYKLFGVEQADKLINARKIMNEADIFEEMQNKILDIIKNMGYRNSLKGIRPTSLEGKIVSDADMCDCLGANGILRVYDYAKANNRVFFDKNILPKENMNAEEYANNSSGSAVCHFFEKILKLKNLMLTDSGRIEAHKREKITIDFLKHIFIEENAKEWLDYLDNYLQIN